jgi:hypothetical protein
VVAVVVMMMMVVVLGELVNTTEHPQRGRDVLIGRVAGQ